MVHVQGEITKEQVILIWTVSIGGDIDRFALDVEEETTTLLEYDIVDLDEPMLTELLEIHTKGGKNHL